MKMKLNLYRLSTIVGCVFLLSSLFMLTLALADEAPKFGDALVNTINALKVGAIGGILVAVGQLLKSDFIEGLLGAKVNSKALPWIHLAIGVLISVGASWGSKIWYISVIEGVIASLVSGGAFDLTKITQKTT